MDEVIAHPFLAEEAAPSEVHSLEEDIEMTPLQLNQEIESD